MRRRSATTPRRPRSASTHSTSSASRNARSIRSVATSGTPTSAHNTPKGRWIKGTRWSLLKAPEKQSIGRLALLGEVQQANKALYHAFLLKEELRLLYQIDDPRLAPAHLDAWLAWASRSRLAPFIRLARTIRRHRVGILAAIRLGLSNGRLEGFNSRIRLISHRSFGFHSAAPLIALVHLCCTGIVIDLPGCTSPQRRPERHSKQAHRRQGKRSALRATPESSAPFQDPGGSATALGELEGEAAASLKVKTPIEDLIDESEPIRLRKRTEWGGWLVGTRSLSVERRTDWVLDGESHGPCSLNAALSGLCEDLGIVHLSKMLLEAIVMVRSERPVEGAALTFRARRRRLGSCDINEDLVLVGRLMCERKRERRPFLELGRGPCNHVLGELKEAVDRVPVEGRDIDSLVHVNVYRVGLSDALNVNRLPSKLRC
jgi:hypothetical protein